MVNYLFATEEQKELADGARKILEDKLKPRIEEFESADGGLGIYPLEVHKALADAGYYASYIPEEWGGLGLDPVTQGIIIEEMGKIDAGFAFSFAGSGCEFPKILATSMPKEEKQMWADRILAGAMGSFNLTESGAGSDAAAMRTTAVKDGDEWVINGTKCFCSNAPTAEYFICVAWTDKTKRASEGVTAFFVEKDRGVQVGKKENKMGLHLAETAGVSYEGRVRSSTAAPALAWRRPRWMRLLNMRRPAASLASVSLTTRAWASLLPTCRCVSPRAVLCCTILWSAHGTMYPTTWIS